MHKLLSKKQTQHGSAHIYTLYTVRAYYLAYVHADCMFVKANECPPHPISLFFDLSLSLYASTNMCIYIYTYNLRYTPAISYSPFC